MENKFKFPKTIKEYFVTVEPLIEKKHFDIEFPDGTIETEEVWIDESCSYKGALAVSHDRLIGNALAYMEFAIIFTADTRKECEEWYKANYAEFMKWAETRRRKPRKLSKSDLEKIFKEYPSLNEHLSDAIKERGK